MLYLLPAGITGGMLSGTPLVLMLTASYGSRPMTGADASTAPRTEVASR